MPERFKPYTAVHIILLKKDKILLMKRKNTGYMDGKWGLPSGHVEQDESLIDCAIRETKEETSIELEYSNLQFGNVIYRLSDQADKRKSVDFFFISQKWSGIAKVGEPDKCEEIEWFKIDELPEETIPYISTAINAIFNGLQYLEIGWGDEFSDEQVEMIEKLISPS